MQLRFAAVNFRIACHQSTAVFTMKTGIPQSTPDLTRRARRAAGLVLISVNQLYSRSRPVKIAHFPPYVAANAFETAVETLAR